MLTIIDANNFTIFTHDNSSPSRTYINDVISKYTHDLINNTLIIGVKNVWITKYSYEEYKKISEKNKDVLIVFFSTIYDITKVENNLIDINILKTVITNIHLYLAVKRKNFCGQFEDFRDNMKNILKICQTSVNEFDNNMNILKDVKINDTIVTTKNFKFFIDYIDSSQITNIYKQFLVRLDKFKKIIHNLDKKYTTISKDSLINYNISSSSPNNLYAYLVILKHVIEKTNKYNQDIIDILASIITIENTTSLLKKDVNDLNIIKNMPVAYNKSIEEIHLRNVYKKEYIEKVSLVNSLLDDIERERRIEDHRRHYFDLNFKQYIPSSFIKFPTFNLATIEPLKIQVFDKDLPKVNINDDVKEEFNVLENSVLYEDNNVDNNKYTNFIESIVNKKKWNNDVDIDDE